MSATVGTTGWVLALVGLLIGLASIFIVVIAPAALPIWRGLVGAGIVVIAAARLIP